MYLKILNLILQPILGGAAGYITNEYAINMLFKSYTPFKIGGIVPKTRDEFITNITKLIEEDILSTDKILSVLNDKKFAKNFDFFVQDFIKNNIYKTQKNQPLKNIEQLNKFIKSLNTFVNSNCHDIVRSITEYSFNNININAILTEKQITYISSHLFDLVEDTIDNTDFLNNIINNYKNNIGDLSLSFILGKDNVNILINNISENVIREDNFYNIEIDKLISSTLECSNFYNSFYNLTTKIIEKRKDDINKVIFDLFNNFLKTDNCNTLINDFSKNLIEYGKNINISIYDIINDGCFDNINSILHDKSNIIIDFLIDFCNENDYEISQIIKEAISETITEQDSGKKLILNMAQSTINGYINKIDIKSYLLGLKSNKVKLDIIINKLSAKIKDIIKNYTIGDITTILEQKNILTETSFSKFIKNYINNGLIFITKNLSSNLSKIIKNEYITTILNSKINNYIKDNLTSDKFYSIYKKELTNKMNELVNYKIITLLNTLNIQTKDIASFASKKLHLNRHVILNKVNPKITSYINNKPITEIINDDISSKLVFEIEKDIKHKINNKLIEINNTNTHDLINKFNTYLKDTKNLSSILRNEVSNNISPILQNFIKGLSKTNLDKLSDKELCDMAKSFIGNNLKPIMYFGGLLGLIAGIGLSLTQINQSNLFNISIIGTITYALVGFLTNAIAISMLFKPYKEIKFLKKLPFFRHFSLGYIAKNKPILAQNMSDGINNYLLTHENMEELIDSYQDKIKKDLSNKLSKDNYEIISKYINNNKNNIINFSTNAINKYISANTGTISTNICSNLEKINLQNILKDYKNSIYNLISDSSQKVDELLISHLTKNKGKNNTLNKLIDKGTIKKLISLLNTMLEQEYDNITKKVNYNNITKYLLNIEPAYQDIIDKNINELLDKKHLDNINNYIKDSFLNIYNDTSVMNKISELFINKINKQVNSNTKLCNLLSGKIKEITNLKLNYIYKNNYDFFKNLFSKYSNKISLFVQNKVTQNLNFIARGAYSMVNGDKIIDSVIDKILIDKLPKLIHEKRDTIYPKAIEILNNDFLEIKLSDINITVENNDSIKRMANFNLIKNKDIFANIIDNFTSTLFNTKSNYKLKDILDKFSLSSIKDIINDNENIIKEEIQPIINNLNSNKQYILNNFNGFICKFTTNSVQNISFSSIIDKISVDDFKTTINNITKLILNKNNISYCTDEMSTNKYTNKNLSQLINTTELNFLTEIVLKDLLYEQKTIELFNSNMSILFDKAIKDNINIMPTQTKEYIIQIFSDTSTLSLKNNLSTIISDLEFDKLIKEQINQMSTKKIHKMFDSFAGKYFKRVMFYGIFGGVFGINTIFGLCLSLAHSVSSLFKKKKLS